MFTPKNWGKMTYKLTKKHMFFQIKVAQIRSYMGVSKNNGTPKSSILIGVSIIFTIHFGVLFPTIFGSTSIYIDLSLSLSCCFHLPGSVEITGPDVASSKFCDTTTKAPHKVPVSWIDPGSRYYVGIYIGLKFDVHAILVLTFAFWVRSVIIYKIVERKLEIEWTRMISEKIPSLKLTARP